MLRWLVEGLRLSFRRWMRRLNWVKSEPERPAFEPLEPRVLLTAVLDYSPLDDAEAEEEPETASQEAPLLQAQSFSEPGELDLLASTVAEGEDPIEEPLRPVLLLPGIGGTLWAEGYEDEWYSTRGLHPDKLTVDPLAGVYDDLIESMQRAGYELGESLFVANYDWRLSPAPGPETELDIDGTIEGLSEQSITDGTFEYAVDYLGYWLEEAMAGWQGAGNGSLESVDIVAHSTGGLVARSYLQSEFYDSLQTLPEVHNLAMVGVPNRGASKAWGPIQNDWGVDVAKRVVLSKIGNEAYERVMAGQPIAGEDGEIHKSEFEGMDKDAAQRAFIERFVPTLHDLLATYPFLADSDDPDDLETINDADHAHSEHRNALALDLNDGLDLYYTADDLGPDGTWEDPSTGRVHDPNRFLEGLTGQAGVIYNDQIGTLTSVTEHEGPIDGELHFVVAMDEFIGSEPEPGQVWYQNHGKDADEPGDGTVPLASLTGQFEASAASDDRVTLINLDTSDSDVDHTGIMGAWEGQYEILRFLLEDETDIVYHTNISTTLAPSTLETLRRVVARGLLNPAEVLLSEELSQEAVDGLETVRQYALDLVDRSIWGSGWTNTLPGMEDSIRDLARVDDAIDAVFGRLEGWLSDWPPDTDGFLDGWDDVDGTIVGPGFEVEVDWGRTFAGLLTTTNADLAEMLGVSEGFGRDQLLMNVAVNYAYSDELTLDMELDTDLLHADASAEVGYSAEVGFDLTFGYDIDPGMDADDRAFVRFNDFRGRLDVDAEDIDHALRVGFVEGGIEGGTFSLNASINNGLVHPDDPQLRFRRADMDPDDSSLDVDHLGALVNALLEVERGGTAVAHFPIVASFAGYEPDAQPYYQMTSDDVFMYTSVEHEFVDFDELWSFATVDSGTMLDVFNRVAMALSEAVGSDVLDQPIPFAQGLTLGDVMNYEQAVEESLIADLVDEDGFLTFRDLEGFITALAEATGLDVSEVDPQYDPDTRMLTYNVAFAYAFEPGERQFNLGVDAGPLGSLGSAGQVGFEASVEGGFTVGLDLSPLEAAARAESAAPADGQLSSDATFYLELGDDEPVEVLVERDTDNTSLDDLVADLNAALVAAGVADRAVARRSAENPDHLEIATKGPRIGSAHIRLDADADDPTVTEMGFNPIHLESDAIRDRAYLEDVTLNGEVSVAAEDIEAFGRFGFLEIDADVDGQLHATADYQLVNPDHDPSGDVSETRIGLMDLAGYLRNDAAATLGGDGFGGMADAELAVSLHPNPFGNDHPDDPRITFDWADLADTDTITLTYNEAMEELVGYGELEFADILNGLAELTQFYSDDLHALPLLGDDLPLINRSVADLFDLTADFADRVGDFAEDPDTTLDELADELAAAMNLDPNQLDLSYDLELLRVDFSLEETFSTAIPLELDLDTLLGGGDVPNTLAGLEQFITAGSDGQLTVDAEAIFNVAFGFDLSEPAAPEPVIFDETGVEVGAKVAGVDLDAELGIDGALGLYVRDGQALLGDPSDGAGMARFTAGLAPTAAGHRALAELGSGDFSVDLTGEAGATLPLYFPDPDTPVPAAEGDSDLQDEPHHLVLQIGDLSDPANTAEIVAPDLSGLFDDLSLTDKLSYLVVGLDFLLERVQGTLERDMFSQSLPLVGDQLTGAADSIETLREDILADLGDALAAAPDAQWVREQLFDVLGPAGLDVLGDLNDDGEVTLDDVVMTQESEEIAFDLRLSPVSFDLGTDLDFDLALPALDLDLEVNPEVALEMYVDLSFGVNTEDGFFLDTSADEQVYAGVEVTIPESSFSGRLAFLQLDVEDDGSFVQAAFTADLIAPGGRLHATELTSGDNGLQLDTNLSGAAKLDLDLDVSFGGVDGFPSLATGLVVDWDFDTSGVGEPSVTFEDVRVSAGEFIDSFVGPIFGQIQEIIDPVMPVVEFLNQPLPVVDYLLDDFTVLDLIAWLPDRYAYVDGEMLAAMDGLFDVIEIVGNMPQFGSDALINLGSFTLDGAGDLTDEEALAGFIPESLGELDLDPDEQFAEFSDEAAAFVEETADAGGSGAEIAFPILSDPSQVFQLLLGQTVNLFTFDVPALEYELQFSKEFTFYPGPPSVSGDLTGALGGRIDLAFGYDTNGFEIYQRTGELADLINGFYISDTANADGTGPVTPEAELWGSLTPGVKVGFGPAGVGVYGGVRTTLGADLHDPNHDGKVHVNEFVRSIQDGEEGLWCTFSLAGEVTGVLGVYFEVLGQRVDRDLVETTLHDFSIFDGPCFPGRFEPNTNPDIAADLGAAPGIHIVNGRIIDEFDIDWYTFDVLHEDSLEILLEYSQAQGNIDVEIYDDEHRRVGRSTSTTDDEHLVLEDLESGTYYMHVFGAGDAVDYTINIDPYINPLDPDDPANSETNLYYVANPDTFYVEWVNYYATQPGDDANDGRSHDAPLATITELLDRYELGENDLVLIDGGRYDEPVQLTDQHSGATFAGAPVPHRAYSDFFEAHEKKHDFDNTFNQGVSNTLLRHFVPSDEPQTPSLLIDSAEDVLLHKFEIDRTVFAGEATGNVIQHSLLDGSVAVHFQEGAEHDVADNTIRDSAFVGSLGALVETTAAQTFAHNTFERRGLQVTEGAAATVVENTFERDHITPVDEAIVIEAGAVVTLEGNRISQYHTGIVNHSFDVTFIDNRVFENIVGMTGTGLLGAQASAEAVRVYENEVGIQLAADTEGAIVQNNRVYDNETGIRSLGDAVNIIEGNDVHQNTVGIDAGAVIGGSDWSNPNHVYDNTEVGILAAAEAELRFNRVFGNPVGIEVPGDDVYVHHNVLYRGDASGTDENGGDDGNGTEEPPQIISLLVDGAAGTEIKHNTIYAPLGHGVVVANAASDTRLRNNIIWVRDGYGLKIHDDSQDGFDSNYNNLYSSDDGVLVHWQKPFADLYDWQVEVQLDLDSIGYTTVHPDRDEPKFRDVDGDDYRIEAEAATSIAAGDPASDYSVESEYLQHDGGRVNLGAYGNTARAAEAPASWLRLAWPVYHVDWVADQGAEIRWDSYNVEGDIRITVEDEAGNTLYTIAELDVDEGWTFWSPAHSDIDPHPNDRYRFRIDDVDSATTHLMRESFSVVDPAGTYYVNDESAADTQWVNRAGDNRLTGTTPSDPKASPLAIRNGYRLGPGDTVHIDTGDYLLPRDLLISGVAGIGEDEGATFTGPTDSGRAAVLDRGLTLAGSAVVDLHGADHTTFRNLHLVGGEHGLHVHTGSTHFAGENLHVRDAASHGVVLAPSAEDAYLDAITSHGHGGRGIVVESEIVSLNDSHVYDNQGHGLYLRETGDMHLLRNHIHGNSGYGINVENRVSGTMTVVGTSDLDSGDGNRVHGNAGRGIHGSSNVLVVGNAITGHEGVRGISLSRDADAMLNVVQGAETGIHASTNGNHEIAYNRVMDIGEVGIEAGRNTIVHGNVVANVETGIEGRGRWNRSFGGEMTNNIIYGHSHDAIYVPSGSDGVAVINNTIDQHEPAGFDPGDDPLPRGIYIGSNSTHIDIRNNILAIDFGEALDVNPGSHVGFLSDYNLFHLTGSATFGAWQGDPVDDLEQWLAVSFHDRNSLGQDPLFVDRANHDYHLQSTQGSLHGGGVAPVLDASGYAVLEPGALSVDGSLSPAIARGDASLPNDNEPQPNGGYINLGGFGNTSQASLSPEQYILLVNPDGGEIVPMGQSLQIAWRSHDTADDVDIHLLRDGESDPVREIVIGADNSGEYIWTLPEDLATADDYRVLVDRGDGLAVTSFETFTITDPVSAYYVNNDSTENAVYTTAPGAAGNDGLSPHTPMSSIRGILEAHDVGYGDTIYVDAGQYDLSTNIDVTGDHAGVRIVGAYDEDNADAVTVLDRNDTSSGSYIFNLSDLPQDEEPALALEHLHLTGARYNIRASSDAEAHNVLLQEVVVSGADWYGLHVDSGNDGWVIRDSVFTGNNRRDLSYEGDDLLLLDNHIHDSTASNAVWLRGANAHVEGNLFENLRRPLNSRSDDALIVDNLFQHNTIDSEVFSGGTVAGNTFANNDSNGLYITNSGTYAGPYDQWGPNEFYGNERGARVSSGAHFEGNLVYDNDRGVYIDHGSSGAGVVGNTIYGNGSYGIRAMRGAFVSENVVFDNGRGIDAVGSSNANRWMRGDIVNNLIYGNEHSAIRLNYGNSSPTVRNNVIIQDHGDVIHLMGNQASSIDAIHVRNNVLQTVDGAFYRIADGTEIHLRSDYNIYHATGDATFLWPGESFDDLADWAFATGLDAHSIAGDPLFVDPANHDYHLQPHSPGVAGGDPDDPFHNEPGPNGGRINIGAYGNTEHATPLPDPDLLQVLAPDPFGKHEIGGEMQIAWRTYVDSLLDDYGDAVLDLNPLAYYRMNETSGSTVSDSSGNDHHAQLDNSASWGATGFLGRAHGSALEPGNQSTRIIAEGEAFDLTQNVSLGLWINVEDTNQDWSPLFHKGDDGETFFFRINNDDLSLRLSTTDAQGEQTLDTAEGAVSLNAWHHVGAVIDRDAEQMKIYVDGERVASQSVRSDAALSHPNDPLYILRQESPPWRHRTYDGRVDEAVIFDEALADSAFQTIGGNVHGTVDIKLLQDSDGVFEPILTIADDVPNVADFASFDWQIDVDSLDVTADHQIRVTHNWGDDLTDVTLPFQFAPEGNDYYINGASTDGNVYTTATGDNYNHGKSPDAPMASINALLEAYEFGPGDALHIDTGTYELLRNIVLDDRHSGLTIVGAGAEDDNAATILDRGRRSSDYHVFDLEGVTDLTLESLEVTGADYGLFSDTDAGNHGLTLRDNVFFGNDSGGARIRHGNDDFVADGNIFHGGGPDDWQHPLSQDYGLRYDGYGAHILNNVAYGHLRDGFYIGYSTNHSGDYLVEDNVAHSNRGDGFTTRRLSDAIIRNNTVYDNWDAGISLRGSDVIITGTHAYGNDIGIYVRNDAYAYDNHLIYDNQTGIHVHSRAGAAENNTVYDNVVGIRGAGSSYQSRNAPVINNVIYNNETGLHTRGWGLTTHNEVFDNTRGILGSSSYRGTLANNLVYGNDEYALRLSSTHSDTPDIHNNTFVHGDEGTAVRVEDSHVDFQNNIIQSGDADLLDLTTSAQASFYSNYNIYHPTGDGILFHWGDIPFDDRADWYYGTGFDAHSAVTDPLFVDAAGGDYHLSPGSPGVATGNPAFAFGNESAPNGGRINIGAFGNTAEATPTLEPNLMQILAPHVLDKHELDRSVEIAWRTHLNGLLDDYADRVQAHDPLAYYRLNETSGPTVTDSSGNDHHAQLDNSADWDVTGFLGRAHGSALEPTSQSTRIIGDGETFDLTHNLSLGMWVYIEDTNQSWSPLFRKGDDGQTFDLRLNNSDMALRLSTRDSQGEQVIETDADVISHDGWHHVGAAIDRDAGQMRIYVDGQEAASGAVRSEGALSDPDAPLYILRQESPPWADRTYDGRLDEVVIYDHALDAAAFESIAHHMRGAVDIDLYRVHADGSETHVMNVAEQLADDDESGAYAWEIPAEGLDLQHEYVFRVTSSEGENLYAQTAPFRFAGDGDAYFINNASTDHGVYTSAAGDNRNTGKTPDAPMASLNALLNAYELTDGDTIYIDSGTHELIQNVVITADHAGVTLVGAHDPDNPDAVTIIDRGTRSSGNHAFELHDASGVTFEHLHFTNARTGIYADDDGGSHDLTVRDSTFYHLREAGIYMRRGNDGLLVEDSLFYGPGPDTFNHPDRQDYGVWYGAHDGEFRNNTAHGHYRDGFYVGAQRSRSDNHVFEHNLAYDNRQAGIYNRHGDDVTIQHNEVHSNNIGIENGRHGALITQNHVYDNDTGIEARGSGTHVFANERVYGNNLGIYVLSGAVAENNHVYDNERGIRGRSEIVGNWAYNNTHWGIQGQRQGYIHGNRVFNNADGIRGGFDFRGDIENNLVYANEDHGIRFTDSDAPNRVINNTVYQEVGSALRLQDTSNPVTVINNILWSDLGYAIRVDADSAGDMSSDYNLLYRGEDGLADTVRYDGETYQTLADWQGATAHDANSYAGDPLFVNMEGANNVLGSSREAALDDNFRLAADSPAIDRAHSWLATPTDIDGHHRLEDPGTTNQGSDDYYPEVLDANFFDSEIGDPEGRSATWDGSWSYTFQDFSFEFYGETYTEIEYGSNGLFHFSGSRNEIRDGSPSVDKLLSRQIVAPFWDDLSLISDNGNDIFIDDQADELTIRWHATHVATDKVVEFSATLFTDGDIRFDYGQVPEDAKPTIGIGNRSERMYKLSNRHGSSGLDHADSEMFTLAPGHIDIGAYEFRGSSLDDTPPVVVGVDPLVIDDAGHTNQPFDEIVVTFSEVLDSINAQAPDSYGLLRADSGGDFTIPLDLQPHYTQGETTVTLDILQGALDDGEYRFVIFGENGVTDLSGIELDGDGDGNPGGDFARTFTVNTTEPVVDFDTLTTTDPTPQLTGTVDDPEADVTVAIAGNVYDAHNYGDGSWIIDHGQIEPLDPGAYDVTVTAADLGGNVGETVVSDGLVIESGIAEVVGRHVFYNNSAFDDDNNDDAIAPDKQALLPGETATFANYTSYVRGINGIIIDIDDLADADALSFDDFTFHVGNNDEPDDWAAAPDPIDVNVRENEGMDDADRVELIWEDGAVAQEWLQIMVLANDATGLETPDVFYFGNAIGSTGHDESSAAVGSQDRIDVRDNPHSFLNPATIDNRYDMNRDGRVGAEDRLIVRDHPTSFLSALRLISVPEENDEAEASLEAATDEVEPSLVVTETDDETTEQALVPQARSTASSSALLAAYYDRFNTVSSWGRQDGGDDDSDDARHAWWQRYLDEPSSDAATDPVLRVI